MGLEDYREKFEKQCYEEAKKRVEDRGFKFGTFWVQYRDSPILPDMDFEDAVTMVLEALNDNGVVAWSGDGTYIVAQLIYKQYVERKKLEKI